MNGNPPPEAPPESSAWDAGEPEYRTQIWAHGPTLTPSDDNFREQLLHYIASEVLRYAHIEVRLPGDDLWRDLEDIGRAMRRDTPQLTVEQIAALGIDEQPPVPYAEPLHFLATEPDFWQRAALAGWIPEEEDLALMRRARAVLESARDRQDR